MKHLTCFIFFLFIFTSFGQKIEIYINGKLQSRDSKIIKVLKFNDEVEIRITPKNENLIDSVKTSGWSEEITTGNVQDKDYRSKWKKKNQLITFIPHKGYISYSFTVATVTSHKGEEFEVQIFNSPKSKITTYSNYKHKYLFYLAP